MVDELRLHFLAGPARIRTAVVIYVRVLVVRTSSLEPLVFVPGAAYLVPGTRTCKRPTGCRIRGTGVCLVREKLLVGRDYLITSCHEQSNAFLRRRMAKRSFPMERGSTAKHHPAAWNPQYSQRCRAEEFLLLCPTLKVMRRFSLSDFGEPR